MTLAERQQEMIEQLSILPDSQERLSALVAKAGRRPAFPVESKVDVNLVPGCVSRVWLVKSAVGRNCHFACHADSPLVGGLVCLLCDLCDGAEAAELASLEFNIMEQLGIWRNLSPTRQQGLLAVQRSMQQFAASLL